MKKILIALACFTVLPAVQAAACLPYEPVNVFLHGQLLRKTYPGPPNYESVADGDEAETGFYLLLATPACTLAPKNDTENTALTNVRLVQLVLDRKGYDHWRPKLGKTVTVKGSLFSPFSGHHHAELLMTVAPPDLLKAEPVRK